MFGRAQPRSSIVPVERSVKLASGSHGRRPQQPMIDMHLVGQAGVGVEGREPLHALCAHRHGLAWRGVAVTPAGCARLSCGRRRIRL